MNAHILCALMVFIFATGNDSLAARRGCNRQERWRMRSQWNQPTTESSWNSNSSLKTTEYPTQEIRIVEFPWSGSWGWAKTTEYPSESWKEETEYPSTEGPTNSWWDIDPTKAVTTPRLRQYWWEESTESWRQETGTATGPWEWWPTTTTDRTTDSSDLTDEFWWEADFWKPKYWKPVLENKHVKKAIKLFKDFDFD